MDFTTFTANHVEQARVLAKENYDRERQLVPVMPLLDFTPDLSEFATNGLGIAAVEQGELVGFVCPYPKIAQLHGLSKGVFIPCHAHGATGDNRARTYDRLYQAAAESWVAKGIFTHAISLYYHDAEAIDMFFRNGFGSRCVDGIRPVSPILGEKAAVEIHKLSQDDIPQLLPLLNGLHQHHRATPSFMPLSATITQEDAEEMMAEDNAHFFGAFENGKLITFLKLLHEAETFVTLRPEMMNITGAFTPPEYRGRSINPAVLDYAMTWLAEQGYTLCGVDYESFNFTARSFWEKHFTPYTMSPVRRIDERILTQ